MSVLHHSNTHRQQYNPSDTTRKLTFIPTSVLRRAVVPAEAVVSYAVSIADSPLVAAASSCVQIPPILPVQGGAAGGASSAVTPPVPLPSASGILTSPAAPPKPGVDGRDFACDYAFALLREWQATIPDTKLVR